MRTISNQTFSVVAQLSILAVILSGLLLLPFMADAQGRPDNPGQSRAAEAQSKKETQERGNGPATTNASVSDNADTAGTSQSASQAGDTEATEAAAEKKRGHDRAAEVTKRDDVSAQLQYIKTLIMQMREAVSGRGIGQQLSEFIQSGRQVPEADDDADPEPDTTDLFSTAVLGISTSTEENSTTTDSDDEIQYEFAFSVTASGSELMIPEGIDSVATGTTGVVFAVLNASGTPVTDGTVSATLDSSATATSGAYVIDAGTSESFTATINFDPVESGDYSAALEQLQVNDTFYDLLPAADYTSALVNI